MSVFRITDNSISHSILNTWEKSWHSGKC